ncbi:hypothetical protein F53441_4462 [Fusarium austroafricanum]|uniref:F-box domain-containing protein n=1 Tax=Fusarium austroafricanum TaxID=2364996 RepID=A0A8H4KMC1_9HYPO|nr:hypothetical protein F53441_4462 [Fusarium austroafricanum]
MVRLRSHTRHEAREKARRSSWKSSPPEIQYLILEEISSREGWSRATLVCKKWQALIAAKQFRRDRDHWFKNHVIGPKHEDDGDLPEKQRTWHDLDNGWADGKQSALTSTALGQVLPRPVKSINLLRFQRTVLEAVRTSDGDTDSDD